MHFSKDFKIAKIRPIEKVKNNNDITNFRPISLLPSFSKIFEKFINDKLTSFLEKFKVISASQYGFRKNHSTEIAVVELIRKIGVAAEEKKFIAGIFLDLTKAFDCIDHEILLSKLEHYGVRGKPHLLLKSYLSCRYQYVIWNGKCSDMREIEIGVPQGSILGPLLFILYINDLPCSTAMFDYMMYADDANLFKCNKSILKLIDETNDHIQHVIKWFANNKLTLNKNKTQLMIYGPVQYLNYKEPFKIMIDEHEVIETKSLKFLGIIIDNKLSFKQHINYVSNKITNSLGAINKIKFFMTPYCLNILYNSICLPHLVYGNIVWASAYPSTIKPLQVIMKRAMRIITNSRSQVASKDLFLKTHNLDFHHLNEYLSTIFIFKHYLGKLPDIFKNYFYFNIKSRHANIIRSNKSKSNILHSHILCYGPRNWNKLISNYKLGDLLTCKTIFNFKKKLKSLLLNVMGKM